MSNNRTVYINRNSDENKSGGVKINGGITTISFQIIDFRTGMTHAQLSSGKRVVTQKKLPEIQGGSRDH